MLITGCIPFETNKEKRNLLNQLKEEFGKGLTIRLDGELILYKYFDNSKIN